MCVGLSLGMSTPRIRGMGLPLLALALLVTGVSADDKHLAVPPHNLAVLTDPFHTRSHLHRWTPTRFTCKREIIFVAATPCAGKRRKSGERHSTRKAGSRWASSPLSPRGRGVGGKGLKPSPPLFVAPLPRGERGESSGGARDQGFLVG